MVLRELLSCGMFFIWHLFLYCHIFVVCFLYFCAFFSVFVQKDVFFIHKLITFKIKQT